MTNKAIAAEALYKEGKLSVSDIARNQGISKGTRYSYLRHCGGKIGAYKKPLLKQKVMQVELLLRVENNSRFVPGKNKRLCRYPVDMEGGVMLGTPLYRYDEVDSTMDVVASLAKGGAPEGLAVLAEQQREGRGRQGRHWFSPPGGNLYVSVLLRPTRTADEIPALAPACGLGVAEALEEFVSVQAGLKWPNDILVRGRKIAGILTESVVQGGDVGYIVVGVGVNLNVESFPEHLVDTATSIRLEIGTPVDQEAFVPVFFRHLDTVYQRFLSQGFAALAEAWNRRDALRGQDVRLNIGTHVLEGIARGISPRGALVLETSEGLQQVSVGEVIEMR